MGGFVSSLYQPAAASDTAISSGDPVAAQAHVTSANHTFENEAESTNAKVESSAKLGKYVSLDCEMIGTTSITTFSVPAHHQPGPGERKEYSILARATLVNYSQVVIYDAYVLPPQGVEITNYRTEYSGIAPSHLDPDNITTKPKPFTTVQREVASLIESRILVGHALKNDLAVLGLTHPRPNIRDTSRYEKFRMVSAVPGRRGRKDRGRTPALRVLASEILGWEIQNNGNAGHDSAEDARAAMALFAKEKKGFDEEVVRKFGIASRRNISTKKTATTNGEMHRNASEDENVGSDSVNSEDEDEMTADGKNVDEAEESKNSTTSGQVRNKRKKRKKKSKAKR